jgi:hypothetical protein
MENGHLGHHGQLAARRAVMESGLNHGNVHPPNLLDMAMIVPVVKRKRRAVGSHAQVLTT